MSILSGFRKQKRYTTDDKGRHQLISTWTHTDTVYDDEGKSLTEIIEDLPAADKKVQQTATDSTNANYEILFSESADNVTKSEEARKSSRLLYNPGTKKLSLAGSKLEVTGSNNGTTEVGGGSMTISRNNNLMEPQLSIYNEHSGGEALLRSNNIQIRDDYTSPTKVMEIQQEDIILTGDTWDGTNTSLKTALANAGAKVLYGTSTPTSAQGEDGQLYVQLKTLDPYLDDFVVDYNASTQGGIDTELDISNLNECVIYIDQYQMVADVETLVGQYEEEVDFQNFNFLEITDDLGDVVLELGTSTGSDDLFVRKRNASDKFILSVVDADATADAIDKIYIKDNGEWLPDNDSTIPSPTSEDVDKVLGATDVGEYGWIDSIRFLDSGASAEVYTDHISVNQAGYGGSSMTRDEIQISNIMGSSIEMTSDDITLGDTWDGTNTSLKDAIVAASGGGSEAVYKTLAEYEALSTADKEDPTKIYFVINEGTKVSPTLAADDGNCNATNAPTYAWWCLSGDASTEFQISDGGLSEYNSPAWWSYHFSTRKIFSKVKMRYRNNSSENRVRFSIQASNDGSTWTEILVGNPKYVDLTTENVDMEFIVDTGNVAYEYIRLRFDMPSGWAAGAIKICGNLEIYATANSSSPMVYYKNILYTPNELPITSTSDAGKILAVNADGLWDKATNNGIIPIRLSKTAYDALTPAQKADESKLYLIDGSIITDETLISPDDLVADDGNVISSGGSMYGDTNRQPWTCFDAYDITSGSYNNYWTPAQNGTPVIGYHFTDKPHKITKVKIRLISNQGDTTNSVYVEGSNDGTNWIDISKNGGTTAVAVTEAEGYHDHEIETSFDTAYSYVRIRFASAVNVSYFGKFVGLDAVKIYATETAKVYNAICYNGSEYASLDPQHYFKEISQTDYDALPDTKNSDGIIYFITDYS